MQPSSRLGIALHAGLAFGVGFGVSLAACGGGKSDSSSSSSGKPAAAAVNVDPAGANALVPAALKDKIVFEKSKIVEERGHRNRVFTLAAPKGWAPTMKGFSDLKPPKDANLGFFTAFQVGTNCDGMCEAKDWAAISEKVNFAQFRDGWKIVKEDKGATSHTIIAEKDDKAYVVRVSWEEGAREYHTCSADLDKEAKDAAPAFAKACEAVDMAED